MMAQASHNPSVGPSERVHHNLRKFTMPGRQKADGAPVTQTDEDPFNDGELPSLDPNRKNGLIGGKKKVDNFKTWRSVRKNQILSILCSL